MYVIWVTTCLLAVGAGAHQQLVDRLAYPTSEAARAVWRASAATPPVTMVPDDGRPVMLQRAPFASQAELPRTIVDRDVQLNLAAAGQFTLEARIEPADTGAHLTLYFRSGRGWYGASVPLAGSGWQRLQLPKSRFRAEGSPAGWDKIDGIRISVWRGKPIDCQVRLRNLAAVWHDVALLVPAGEDLGSEQRRGVLRVVDDMRQLLAELGIETDAIATTQLTRQTLGQRSLVVIPYAPRLQPSAVAVLQQLVDRGGKLFACYSIPSKLAATLGIGRLRYYRPERQDELAEIRFQAPEVAGLPASVRQRSWNVHVAEQLSGGARAIGYWYDADGQPTKLPAMVLGPQGAYFSHIVLPDDRQGKRQMLAAVLGHLVPQLWPEMAQRALQSAGQVGHLTGVEAVAAFVRAGRSDPEATAALNSAIEADQTARRLVQSRQFAAAVQQAATARQQLVQAYLRAAPSRTTEGRAFWNHSGTGIYPGDWERTARELADAGINMILPNMLWAGRAHYRSDVLPRSETFKTYGDQIAQCVAAAHRHGIEVHVWKVNHNLSGAPRAFVERLKREGRLQVGRSGQTYNWLCPSDPRNFQLEVDSMLEVARNYEVDGLHFDYIRYPNGDHCYCDGCRKRFEAQLGRPVSRWPDDCYRGPLRQQYRDWRCEQITRLVATVSRQAKQIRPGIKISAAVFGRYPQCRDSVGQDWVAWIRAGYLDFVCPMDYTQSDAQFRGLVENQMRLVNRRIPLYPGVGAFRLTPDRMVGQILIARKLGADGFTVFNLEPGSADALLAALRAGIGSSPAQPPHRAP